MKDTFFSVPSEKVSRVAQIYQHDPQSGKLVPWKADHFVSSVMGYPQFPSGEGGLYSTADDYLLFARMLLGRGRLGKMRFLSEESVRILTVDRLTAEQRKEHSFVLSRDGSWDGVGFGLGVDIVKDPAPLKEDHRYLSPGSFWWPG